MDKLKRAILFYTLVLAFLVVTPSIILYAQGYIFDWQLKRIVKTGGIFVKTTPTDALVNVSAKGEKRTGFFNGEAYFKNLKPAQYKINVSKEGYISWEKTLLVNEQQVAGVQNLILFSKNISFGNFNFATSVSSTIAGYFSPYAPQIDLVEDKGKNWEIYNINLENNAQKVIFISSAQKKMDLRNIEYNQYNKRVLLTIRTNGVNTYYIVEPENDEIPVYKTADHNEALGWLNMVSMATVSSTIKKAEAYKAMDNGVIWLAPNGFVYRTNYENQDIKAYNEEPLKIQKKSDYQIIANNSSEPFILEGKKLYYLDRTQSVFKEIYDNVDRLVFSPFDWKKVLLYNKNEILVFFLGEVDEQPQRKQYELAKINKYDEEIGQVVWINSNYIVLTLGEKIILSEIDNRDKINSFELGKYPNPKIMFNGRDKKLYIYSNGQLMQSTKLLD